MAGIPGLDAHMAQHGDRPASISTVVSIARGVAAIVTRRASMDDDALLDEIASLAARLSDVERRLTVLEGQR